jgi:hypothetical protein
MKAAFNEIDIVRDYVICFLVELKYFSLEVNNYDWYEMFSL